MTFINIILENSTDKIAKLYNPAIKASQKPETGITIQNKAAYHVIKDCAILARNYIPICAFAAYSDPFSTLKGKFTKQNIKEFVSSTEEFPGSYHLLCIILDKIQKLKKESVKEEPKKEENEIVDNDPYGEYGIDNDTTKYVNQYSQPTSYNQIVDLLCEMFGVSN